MNPERWQQLKKWYEAVEDCASEERTALLEQVEAEDPEISEQLRALLAQHKQTDDFLESSVADLVRVTAIPATIGRYRLLCVLGEGGMGTVYEAEQQQPRRTVALKVIKPGFAGPELLRRFEQESQALGRLQHPGIAQIYEAGTADTGFGSQPYFAMELIRGQNLLQYAEAHRLTTRQRLELMVKICEAVQHAHQRGIIHRDIKPANILVEEGGQPKILDFGVARVTDSDAQATRQTDVGQIVGTLAYMSPEQVLADPLALDTRSDVYALGVVLFELLTGNLPYKIGVKLHEAVDTIRDQDPIRLSSMNRTYRGDIETIVAKALEKDKERRYSSAAGMAADIQRYLNDEPITAKPASTRYQLQKFTRRHKALVIGVAAVFVALCVGLIAAVWQAKRAEAESATARAISEFLQNDLMAQASAATQSQPDTKPDPDLKVRTVLDRASANISGKFNQQPIVEAALRQTIGDTYRELGVYPEAQRQLRRALDLRLHVLGENNRDTLTTISSLALLYQFQGQYAQAKPLSMKAVEMSQRVLGKDHPDTLLSMNNLALLYQFQGQYREAESLFKRVVEADRRVLGREHPDTLLSKNNLAFVYQALNQYAQAEPLYQEVLQARRRVLGVEHPETLRTIHDLALLHQNKGEYAQAESLYQEALQARRRVLGVEHPDTLMTMGNLATLYHSEGQYAQAEPLYKEVLQVQRRVIGEEHPNTIASTQNLASLYQAEGKYPEAEALFTKALESERKIMGEEHPNTLIIEDNLASLYRNEHKYVQAEALFIKLLDSESRVLDAASPTLLRHTNHLASLYLDEGKYIQAEALLRKTTHGSSPGMSSTWDQSNYQCLLGASLAGQKRYVEAEPLLLAGYKEMLQLKGKISRERQSLIKQRREWTIQLYESWGKPEKAAELRTLTASATR